MKLATRHFIAAGLLATLGLASTAQTPPPATTQGPAAHGMQVHDGRGRMMDPATRQERMQERMARRMDMLKQKLQITPAQEGAWSNYVAALKPTLMQRPSRDEFQKMRTPERIDRMRAMRTARVAEADKRGDATKYFYMTLNVEQQKTFDEIGLRFMRGKGGRGGYGGGHGHHHHRT